MILIKSFLLINSFIFLAVSGVEEKCKVINCKNGLIRGTESRSMLQNVTFCSYKGIPYGKAPVGELRFKPPQPADAWRPNILNATNYGSVCYAQVRNHTSTLNQSEDCLNINVFVPNATTTEKLPVVFVLIGGDFYQGGVSDELYGPDFIIENDVILVTSNYRLGALGWMSLGTCEYPGNMGLKDQQLALKWVNENIEAFGGDKTKVTIVGRGAGAVCAHYHVFSPESRKLFHRAALISSSAFNYYGIPQEKSDLKRMYDFMRKVNQSNYNYKDLVAFLKEVSIEDIIEHLSFNENLRSKMPHAWTPVIEGCMNDQTFLTQTADEFYGNPKSNSDIDMMFGVMDAESQHAVVKDILDPSRLNHLNTRFDIILPFPAWYFSYDSKQQFKLAKRIKKFYFGHDRIGNETLFDYLRCLSYMNYEYGITDAVHAQTLTSNAKTYYYRFSFVSPLNLYRTLNNLTSVPMTGHGDDIGFLFNSKHLSDYYAEILATKDVNASSLNTYQALIKYPKLLTNFAKTGDPTIEGFPSVRFTPCQKDGISQLDITNDGLILGYDPRVKEHKFWQDIDETAERMVEKRSKRRRRSSRY